MTRSGWCGIGFPLKHVNHRRCDTERWQCGCACHATRTPAAEGAPGAIHPGSEPGPSAAGSPDDGRVMSIQAAPGAVIMIIDPDTAAALADQLEQTYTSSLLPDLDRDMWLKVRLAARAADRAVQEARRLELTITPPALLRLVGRGGQS